MIERAEEVKSISVRLFAPVRIDKIVFRYRRFSSRLWNNLPMITRSKNAWTMVRATDKT